MGRHLRHVRHRQLGDHGVIGEHLRRRLHRLRQRHDLGQLCARVPRLRGGGGAGPVRDDGDRRLGSDQHLGGLWLCRRQRWHDHGRAAPDHAGAAGAVAPLRRRQPDERRGERHARFIGRHRQHQRADLEFARRRHEQRGQLFVERLERGVRLGQQRELRDQLHEQRRRPRRRRAPTDAHRRRGLAQLRRCEPGEQQRDRQRRRAGQRRCGEQRDAGDERDAVERCRQLRHARLERRLRQRTRRQLRDQLHGRRRGSERHAARVDRDTQPDAACLWQPHPCQERCHGDVRHAGQRQPDPHRRADLAGAVQQRCRCLFAQRLECCVGGRQHLQLRRHLHHQPDRAASPAAPDHGDRRLAVARLRRCQPHQRPGHTEPQLTHRHRQHRLGGAELTGHGRQQRRHLCAHRLECSLQLRQGRQLSNRLRAGQPVRQPARADADARPCLTQLWRRQPRQRQRERQRRRPGQRRRRGERHVDDTGDGCEQRRQLRHHRRRGAFLGGAAQQLQHHLRHECLRLERHAAVADADAGGRGAHLRRRQPGQRRGHRQRRRSGQWRHGGERRARDTRRGNEQCRCLRPHRIECRLRHRPRVELQHHLRDQRRRTQRNAARADADGRCGVAHLRRREPEQRHRHRQRGRPRQRRQRHERRARDAGDRDEQCRQLCAYRVERRVRQRCRVELHDQLRNAREWIDDQPARADVDGRCGVAHLRRRKSGDRHGHGQRRRLGQRRRRDERRALDTRGGDEQCRDL